MKRSTLVIASILILAAGVIAVAMTRGGDDNNETARDENPPPRRPAAASADGSGFKSDEIAKAAPRSERDTGDRELVEQYGDARTKLARNVSENVVGLLDDFIGVGEMMMSGSGPDWGGGNWQIRRALRGTGIELTEVQQEQARTLLSAHRERELQRTKDAVENLRSNPKSLMSLLLAGDAFSRGDLTEEEYAALQRANADQLGDIINPLDRDNFRGSSPLEDETFRSSFESMLDADQAAAFREAQAAREAEGDGEPSQTDITRMPAMDLEAADEAIRSARQMSGGFRQVIEGMGNLGPLLDQQRRAREESE